MIAWGTGHLGRQGLAQIIRDPALELVGLKVASPDKVGRDAGEIAGIGPAGIVATDDVAALLALGADCVAYFANTAGRAEEAVAEIVPFLASGVNVATIAHFDAQYPRHGAPTLVDPLQAAAEKGASSILLTGEEPGFAFGQHLFAILSTCVGVDTVRMVEMSDVQNYAGRASLDLYGFNGDPAELPAMFTSPVGASWHVATLLGIADFLGLGVDDVSQTWDNAVADRPVASAAYGLIEPGRTAATRWTVTAHARGRPLLTYQKILRMDHEAAPEWERTELGRGIPGVTHKIMIEGDTPVREELFRPKGVSATPTIAVNAIPFVCEAPPGVLRQHDVPLFPPRVFR